MVTSPIIKNFPKIFYFVCIILFYNFSPDKLYAKSTNKTSNTSLSTILYVTVSGSGTKDGSSWANAMDNIQLALDTATADTEIWIQTGTYTPTEIPEHTNNTTTDNRNKAFHFNKNIKLYGGFIGTETLLSERDSTTNPTIFSGDIGTLNVETDNCYHILILDNQNGDIIIDGIQFTGSYYPFNDPFAPSGTIDYGSLANIPNENGAIYNASSATFTECTFSKNISRYGGAVYNESGNPTFNNCKFNENSSYENGGAIYNSNNNSIVITEGSFTSNTGSRNGGAIFNSDNSSIDINEATFLTNSAPFGGAIYNSSNIKLNRCYFYRNNTTDSGGAIYNLDNTLISSQSVLFTNCIFNENYAGRSGGAIFSTYNQKTITPIFTNCVFNNNSCPSSGGAVYYNIAGGTITPKFTNSVFSNNSAALGDALYNNHTSGTVNYNFTNSIFWSNASGTNIESSDNTAFTLSYCFLEYAVSQYPSSNFTINNSEHEVDPLFKDMSDIDGNDNILFSSDDGLSLQSCPSDSPAIDVGTTTSNNNTDITGKTRPKSGTNVDIGAYENTGDTPEAVTPQASCNVEILSDFIVIGQNLKWYDEATGGMLLNPNTSVVIGETYYVSQSIGICESERVGITVVGPEADIPTIIQIIQPSCNVETGSFIIQNYNENYTYTFSPNEASISDTSTGKVTAKANKSYTVTATGTDGCTSDSSSSITINAQPATPNAPTFGTVTHPNCTITSGSFSITNFNAAYTYQFSPSGPTIDSSGKVTANSGTYTITAKANGCTSNSSNSVTINTQPATPDTPVLEINGHPTCTNSKGTFSIKNYNASYTYTFNKTGVTINSSGLATAEAGTYTVTATNTDGCTSSSSSSITINTQPATPNAPTFGTVTHPNCTITSGSFSITNFNAAYTYQFSPSGPTIDSSGKVTANSGTYTITAKANGCTSNSSNSVTINTQPATPDTPVLEIDGHPTCTNSKGTFSIKNYNASYTYTFNKTGVTINSSGLATAEAGTYTVTATNTDGCTSSSSSSITINAQPATPNAPTFGAVTHPSCTITSGSFSITNFNAAYTYQFSPSGPTIDSSGKVTANSGTYTITAKANGCTSNSSNSVTINTQPATPDTPVLEINGHPTCTNSKGTFSIKNHNASYTYTFNKTGVTINSSGLATAEAGTYTVTATNTDGCTSSSSSSITINAQPATPNAPTFGAVTHPNCTITSGSFSITNFNAAYTYQFSPSGPTIDSSGKVTANSGTYTITAKANGCTSNSSNSVTINTQPATPDTPVLEIDGHPTCTNSKGTFFIKNHNASYTYTFNKTGVTINSSGLATAEAGTYTVTATNTDGCTSSSSSSITINAQPATPNAPTFGTVTHPNCTITSGSFSITNFNAAYTYQFSPSGPTIDSSGKVTANSGTYTITAKANGCTSNSSNSVTINTQPATPDTPVLEIDGHPTCTNSKGTFSIKNYNASYTYTFNKTGVTINSSGLATAEAGTYTVTATNTDGCTSSSSSSITINAQPATPNAPTFGTVTHPNCTITSGSFSITNFNAAYTYQFSPSGPTIDSSGKVTANSGTYTITAKANGCTSNSSNSVTINTQPATPDTPVLEINGHPTCTNSKGTFSIKNHNASYTYTFNKTGVTINSSGLATAEAGTYTVTATNTDGCTSSSSSSITINAQPATPNAPTLEVDEHPTCTDSKGTFSIRNYNANYTYTFNDTSVTIDSSGLATVDPGTYTVTATNTDGCTSEISNSITINTQPITPNIPTIGTVTHPNCTITSGSFSITNFNAAYTYQFSPSGPTIDSSGNVTANSGTYTITAKANGCTSNSSNSVTINTQPATPDTPVLEINEHPTCTNSKGTFSIKNYNASYTYTFNKTGVTINSSGLATAEAGTYTVTATNTDGCTSSSSNSITINAQPTTPDIPTLEVDEHPTCTDSKGTFSIRNYNASYTYTFNDTSVTIDSSGLATVDPGTYTVTATNTDGCTSEVSNSITINTQPITPNTPTIGAVTQPTCDINNGSFSITNFNTAYTYQFSPSGPTIDSFGKVTANTGTYTITATNTDGCISEVSDSAIIDMTPQQPSTPILEIITQTTCSNPNGTFSIRNYNSTNVYEFTPTGPTIDASGIVSATAGTYTVNAIANGCTSETSNSVTLVTQPAKPNKPTFGTITQPTCTNPKGNFSITNYDSTNNYEFTPTGPTIDASGFVSANTGTYTITAIANGCTSETSDSIKINIQPTTPNIPNLEIITHPSCTDPKGMFLITNYNSDYIYTFNQSGATVDSSGFVTAEPGTYTVSAKKDDCISVNSNPITINTQPSPPNKPTIGAIEHPSCKTPKGSFSITNFDSVYTYEFSPSGPTIDNFGKVTADPGIYTFTANNNGCISEDSNSIEINTQPLTPSTPTFGSIIQPTCSNSTGSFSIINFDTNNTYKFTPEGPTINSSGFVIANSGNYTLTATAPNGCTSLNSSTIIINPQPITPDTPTISSITQPTCDNSMGRFSITNYDTENTYVFSPTGPTIDDSGIVTASEGIYTVIAKANGCTSESSNSVEINAQPLTPSTPTFGSIIQPTCSNSTGSFSIINFDTNNTYKFTPEGPTINSSGLVIANSGNYTLTATAPNGCTSLNSSTIIINPQPITPDTPTISSITQPTCDNSMGRFSITNYDTANTYVFSPTGPTIDDSGIVTASEGIYTVIAKANGCTSESSNSVEINAQPSTPSTPTFGTITQPTCSNKTGSFSIINFDANNTYKFTPEGPTINSSGLVTANPGNYTLTATASNGCTSPPSISVMINAKQAIPTTGKVIQPTCTNNTGSFSIINFDSNNTYQFSPVGPTINDIGVVTANSGTYTITSTANGCTSTPSDSITIEAQPTTPETPSIGAITHPSCNTTTGNFSILNFNSTNTYIFSPTGPTINSTGIVTASEGTYTITSSSNECVSSSTSVIINQQPETPDSPIIGAITQPTCTNETASFFITNFNSNYSYTFSPTGPSIDNSGLVIANTGNYTITTNANGCTSNPSNIITVDAQPEISDIPSSILLESFITVNSEANNSHPHQNMSVSINTSTNYLGPGEYQYAIVNKENNSRIPTIGFQSEPFFENLEVGIYTIIVNDKDACNVDTTLTIPVIYFPKFFTPNEDGIYDTWKVKSPNNAFQSDSKISIFNRLGILIGQIPIDSKGWDGTYNGVKLPSSDYWYNALLIPVDKTIPIINKKGHFSLLIK